MIKRTEDEAKEKADKEARKIIGLAIQRCAAEHAVETTVSVVNLPSDEMKGRIIGREGRNIRAIEAATGASVLIDDTPEAVVISCFDPVRREIARLTMERLIADGRIHPTRIEEMVEKVTKEVENDILKVGQETIEKLNVTGVKQNIVKLIGRLKYRYSYSQNVLNHSIEVAYLMGAIASQIGLDERKARRAGLLHDIGKAVDHEVEGTHALIGVDLLKRNGEDDEVARAVGCHHEEMECSTPYGTLLKICDKLSASRPGARAETTELYIKRLEQMEGIGKAFPGVEICYAIQAGRELRVLVHPEKIGEDKALLLARDIAGQIEKEMRYPGQIKVTVIRETRVTEYAK
jgi:ribonuclease Y